MERAKRALPPRGTKHSRRSFAPNIATKQIGYAWCGPEPDKLPMRPRSHKQLGTEDLWMSSGLRRRGGVIDAMRGLCAQGWASQTRAVSPRDPLSINTSYSCKSYR